MRNTLPIAVAVVLLAAVVWCRPAADAASMTSGAIKWEYGSLVHKSGSGGWFWEEPAKGMTAASLRNLIKDYSGKDIGDDEFRPPGDFSFLNEFAANTWEFAFYRESADQGQVWNFRRVRQ